MTEGKAGGEERRRKVKGGPVKEKYTENMADKKWRRIERRNEEMKQKKRRTEIRTEETGGRERKERWNDNMRQ